jgi:hypothetical protein
LCTVTDENKQSLGMGLEYGKVWGDSPILPGRETVVAGHSSSVEVVSNRATDEQSVPSKSDPVEVLNAVLLPQETDIACGFTQDLNTATPNQNVRMMRYDTNIL